MLGEHLLPGYSFNEGSGAVSAMGVQELFLLPQALHGNAQSTLVLTYTIVRQCWFLLPISLSNILTSCL